MVLVFHFRLGERGAAGDAPVNRLLPAINKTLFDNVREQAQFVCLVFLVERQIRFFPFAENAQAFELDALEINVFARVGVAGFADRGGVGVRVAGLAHFLGDLEFDGQTVAVPARDVGRVLAAEGFEFDDDVLENLVQRGADVDIAIRERRAVMQHKFCFAAAPALDFCVQAGHLPPLQPQRFARHQIGPHREVRPRQIQCVFVFHFSVSKESHHTSGGGRCQRAGRMVAS